MDIILRKGTTHSCYFSVVVTILSTKMQVNLNPKLTPLRDEHTERRRMQPVRSRARPWRLSAVWPLALLIRVPCRPSAVPPCPAGLPPQISGGFEAKTRLPGDTATSCEITSITSAAAGLTRRGLTLRSASRPTSLTNDDAAEWRAPNTHARAGTGQIGGASRYK